VNGKENVRWTVFWNCLIRTIAWFCFVFFQLFFPAIAPGQTGVHIVHFDKKEYKGGNQNWDVSAAADGRVFVANNEGLIVLDGSGSRTYPLPSRTSIRSVLALEKRVYTGSFEEAGYWEAGEHGTYTYTSLVPLLKEYSFKNDEFWKIVSLGEHVFFQSFGTILKFDGNSLTPVEIPGTVLFLLKADNRLFIQQIGGGLFSWSGTAFAPIPGSTIFSDTEVKAILPGPENNLIIGTSTRGLYLWNGTAFSIWKNDVNALLSGGQLNNGIRLANGNLVFGTILNGAAVVSLEGKLIKHIHSGIGLQNNTVLSLTQAPDGNLWAGLDKGFDFIQFDAPIDVYRGQDESIGSVYAADLSGPFLYVGTNQGIYRYQANADGRFGDRELVEGSQGQTWFIKTIDGRQYAGLNEGTFLLEKTKLKRVSSATGGFNLVPVQHADSTFLLQGTYASLVRYGKKDGVWRQQSLVDGITAPLRFVEPDYTGKLLLGHTVRGMYSARLSTGFDSLQRIKKLGIDDGLPEEASRFHKVDNRILFPTGRQIYQWDADAEKVTPFSELNASLGSFARTKHISNAGGNRYWFIKDDEIGMFEVRYGSARLLYRIIPGMYTLNLVERYENIVALNDSLHLFCLEDGFALLNLYRMNRLTESPDAPRIHRVVFTDGVNRSLEHAAERFPLTVASDLNTVGISFGSATPSVQQYYSHRLSGLDSTWSAWSQQTNVSFSRLPAGTYDFQVRTLTPKGIATSSSGIAFTIRRPWFLSTFGFAVELFFLVTAFVAVRSMLRRRKWRQQEKQLRDEHEKMRLEKEHAEAMLLKTNNERLNEEVSAKNLELAKNTMMMLRKNESFITVRSELEKLKEELGYRLPAKRMEAVLRMIDEALDSENDWEHFEHLFDKAHGGFFRRLMEGYPELTPSDLRLCAYLRMSLTSKEIAPLLNITLRGVEEKRYRLRKRLNLTQDQGLTDFILNF
jgi:cell division protein FtsB/DNA-binding CsgD family transcriptional regulator